MGVSNYVTNLAESKVPILDRANQLRIRDRRNEPRRADLASAIVDRDLDGGNRGAATRLGEYVSNYRQRRG